MRRDLENGYVPSYLKCQCNKSTTTKPIRPLHLLPIPDQRGDSVTINFIGLLPKDEGNNCIITFTDCLGSDIQLTAMHTDITGEQLAYCRKDMRSYPSFISFTFHHLASVSHDSFPYMSVVSHVTIYLLTSLPPLHLLLWSRHSIVAHPNRQVLLCIIRSLTLYSKRTSVSSVD